MATTLKPDELLFRLDLHVGPLGILNKVTVGILVWEYQAHRNFVNVTDVDRGGVDLAASPCFKSDWFLPLLCDSDLSIVHIAPDRHSFGVVRAVVVVLEVLVPLCIPVVKDIGVSITGIGAASERDKSMNPL